MDDIQVELKITTCTLFEEKDHFRDDSFSQRGSGKSRSNKGAKIIKEGKFTPKPERLIEKCDTVFILSEEQQIINLEAE